MQHNFPDESKAQAAVGVPHEQLEFHRLLQNLPAAAYTCNADGLITYFNQHAVQLWGRTPRLNDPIDRFCGSLKLLTPDGTHIPHEQCWMALTLQNGQEYNGQEILIERPDGKRLTVLVHANPLRDEAGNIVGAVNVVVDITDRKQALEAQSLLAAIVKSSDDAIYSRDMQGKILSWNMGAQRLYGYEADEVIGQPISLITPSDRQVVEQEIVDRICFYERVEHFETVRIAKDGRRIDVSLTISPIHDSSGRIIGISKIARDITARKLAEQELNAVRKQLQLVTDSMGAPVTRCSRDQRYLWVSKPYAEWLGRQPEELIGRRISDVIGEAGYQEVRPYVERVLNGEIVEYEAEVNYRDLGPRWIHAVYNPTFDSSGVPDGWVAVILDVTQRREMEESLKQADRRKDEFLATLAHELRNPLAPISNALHILRLSGELPPAAERVREIMERQVVHLVRLVEDLLEVSRITRGKIELRKESVKLARVIESAVDTSRPLIEAAGHQLAIAISPEVITLQADPVRLAQVISNLLNNAAKYTDSGGQIWLTARREGAEVVISVRDSGVGIPADMLPRVFDMFEQVDHTLIRAQGGLGIGLTLARNLVQLHGGQIEVRSEGPGHGSEFIVRLPLPAVTSAAHAPTAGATAAKTSSPVRRILVVDDAQAAVFILGRLLQALGQQVRTARSAAEALECVKAECPDVIISDIAMPNMDGYELARRLRQEPGLANVVLVALTGYGQDSDRMRAREAGFDHHLVKPVGLDALQELLKSLPLPAESAVSGTPA